MTTTTEQAKVSIPEKRHCRPLPSRDLAEILEQHGDWLDSNGDVGIQADFSHEDLEGADLVDSRLQDALLNKAILKGADLMLADLREASLLQANLQDANLLGTMFQQANLQAASISIGQNNREVLLKYRNARMSR